MELTTGSPSEVNMSESRLALLDTRLEAAVEEQKVPGLVYLIVKSGIVVRHRALGFRQLVPERHPMSVDTWFDLASLTKIVFSTLVMYYVERGVISLSEPVSETIVELRGTDKEQITLWHLLTHTSGLPGEVQLFRYCRNRREVVDAIMKLPLLKAPGQWVEYSCLGFILLDECLSRKVGKWPEKMVDHILAPLGLKEICYNPKGVREFAATEFCPWRDAVICGQVHDENAYVMGGVSANAGLFGTARAVAAFGQSFLTSNSTNERVLSPQTIRAMSSNHTPKLNLARGLGWQGYTNLDSPGGDLMPRDSFGHTGFTGTSLWIDPRNEVVAVLFTNRIHTDRNNDHIFRLRSIFHNLIASSIVE